MVTVRCCFSGNLNSLFLLTWALQMIGLGARLVSGLDRRLTFTSLIRVRLISPILMYFFLSVSSYPTFSTQHADPVQVHVLFVESGFQVAIQPHVCGRPVRSCRGLTLFAQIWKIGIRGLLDVVVVCHDGSVILFPLKVLFRLFTFVLGDWQLNR